MDPGIEPFLGGATSKGKNGSLSGLRPMRSGTLKLGQNLDHNGGKPHSAGLETTGPSRRLRATLGTGGSKLALAEETAAKPLREHEHMCRITS